jgi:hypothetical protein
MFIIEYATGLGHFLFLACTFSMLICLILSVGLEKPIYLIRCVIVFLLIYVLSTLGFNGKTTVEYIDPISVTKHNDTVFVVGEDSGLIRSEKAKIWNTENESISIEKTTHRTIYGLHMGSTYTLVAIEKTP